MKARVISRKKLLCSTARADLLCAGCRLFCRRRGEKAEFFVGSLAESLPEDVLSRLRLSSRLLRLEPRCGLFLDDDTALVCWHGRVFRVSLPDRRIAEEHRFRPGMSSPLALVPIRDNPGFEDCVLYGEYINDGAENEIRIFRRASGSGVWAPVFSFEAGRIKHIHAIFSCPRRESLIVFTGDKDCESGIWEIARDFSGLRRILGGSQQFRAVAGFVTEDGIVYATDAPNEPNGLFFCDYTGGSRRRLAEIAGPAIYGAPLPGGRYVFSTSVEPEKDRGLRSWVSYRRGRGIADSRSHLYLVEPDLTVRELYAGKKDLLPMRLFGFGTFQFPQGQREGVTAVGQSLRGLDGKTIALDF